MKRSVIIAIGIVSAVAASLAQSTSGVEQEILKLERVYENAYLKKDRAGLERLLSDDFLQVHSNGTVHDRTEEISEAMSADIKWTGSKLDSQRVRVYGDTVVLTGIQTLTGSGAGYVSGARRYTFIWVRHDGRWQIVGGQSTLVPSK